jgi:hypothetical protein
MGLAQPAEQTHVSLSAPPETVIVPDQQLAHATPGQEHTLDELGCIERCERGCERENDCVVHPSPADGLKLLADR